MSNKTIIANWKMNGSAQLIEELSPQLVAWAKTNPSTKAVICPPFTHINAVKLALFDTDIALGGQDCHEKASGAYTGNVSAEMLVEMGATYVIVGHSERRQYHAETDELVQAKAEAALKSHLIPVVCVGESLEDRDAGRAVAVVTAQAKQSAPTNHQSPSTNHFLLAYEPIWAIGSGRVPSLEDIAEMHSALKAELGQVQVLYGGSVNAANAQEILALDDVDGALVGGASLKAEEFLGILKAGE